MVILLAVLGKIEGDVLDYRAAIDMGLLSGNIALDGWEGSSILVK